MDVSQRMNGLLQLHQEWWSRSETAAVVLDLDGDGDERTGWVVFYFHIETKDRVPVG